MSARPSDTEVQSYIRGTTTYKSSFVLRSIGSSNIEAQCNCSAGAKGQLCKHIWAGLLKIEQNQSDFLDGKTSIEISARSLASQPAAKVAYKEKQNDYRKLQYQKQKLRLQQKKIASKNKSSEPTFEPPFEVARALNFFSKNGFSVSIPVDISILNLAKKKLSRIFHPDTGGTHAEILELNKNFDVLMNFSKLNSSR